MTTTCLMGERVCRSRAKSSRAAGTLSLSAWTAALVVAVGGVVSHPAIVSAADPMARRFRVRLRMAFSPSGFGVKLRLIGKGPFVVAGRLRVRWRYGLGRRIGDRRRRRRRRVGDR